MHLLCISVSSILTTSLVRLTMTKISLDCSLLLPSYLPI